MWTYNYQRPNELYHHGVKGMKWGVRHDTRSGSISAMVARRQNKKIDNSFKKWREGSDNRSDAIRLGKEANIKRMAYEADRKNRTLKKEYKSANKEYKRALRSNTTYRKGQVKSEVGKDLSRKYLSRAKKAEKALQKDPKNKALRKEYKYASDRHDVERMKARRAPAVAARRSRTKANMKRGMTIAVKAAAFSAAVGVGVAYANKKGFDIKKEDIYKVKKYANMAQMAMSFMY